MTLLEVVTTGDRWSAQGGTDATRGLFVKELEEALLDGRADLAVHSAKDLPGELPAGLGIVAVPERADPRDVLVGPVGGLAALAAGAQVGTGSPRRAAQLRLLRPDVGFVEIRGNVGTRVAKRDRGEVDALVLAAAGLARLGLAPQAVTPFAVTECVPAPGQGALAIEGRTDRADLREALAPLDDPPTAACVAAERALLAGLGGGCREPVGAIATVADGALEITAFAESQDGTRHARCVKRGDLHDPVALGDALAAAVRQELGAR